MVKTAGRVGIEPTDERSSCLCPGTQLSMTVAGCGRLRVSHTRLTTRSCFVSFLKTPPLAAVKQIATQALACRVSGGAGGLDLTKMRLQKVVSLLSFFSGKFDHDLVSGVSR